MPKPTLNASTVHDFLKQRWPRVSGFHQLTEGLASQAFGFEQGADAYVMRLGRHAYGFEKDAFVSRTFGSVSLPVPEVLEVGHFGDGLFFCISRRAMGQRLFDLDAADMPRMVIPVAQTMSAIAASDLSSTRGFGSFDPTGSAPFATWRDYLTGITDLERFSWLTLGRKVNLEHLDLLFRRVTELAEVCPENRCLIHGDFGSYNLLTDGQRITAVIDWDRALFGDPWYDVANLHFWHETRLEPLIDSFASQLASIPQGRERLLCYQLRIGLQEIYESAIGENPGDITWLMMRCLDLTDLQDR
jgi:hygromycin-B 4-O-kinase